MIMVHATKMHSGFVLARVSCFWMKLLQAGSCSLRSVYMYRAGGRMGGTSEDPSKAGALMTAGDFRRIMKEKIRAQQKRGYCEMCQMKYDDIDKVSNRIL